MSTLRLWGMGTPRTMRPHWTLAELGLEYETREVLPRTATMETEEFLRVSRRGKVPILEDGDLIVGESGAIAMHLADRYRERAELTPPLGSDERALFYDLCLFTLMELDAPLYIIRRHGGLPEIYGESTVAVDSAREYFLRQVDFLDRRFSDGRTYLLGDAFTVADILFSTCIEWGTFIGIDVSDRLQNYQTVVTSRPAYSVAAKRNFSADMAKATRNQRGTGD